MSTFEAAYPPPLQGVSQQQPAERLDGQVSEQLNMVSDPVTGVRRRPGAAYSKDFAWAGVDHRYVLTWFTGIARARCHILLNTSTGQIKAYNEDYTLEFNISGGAYLQNSDPSRIRAVSVNNELYLLNCDVMPTVQYTNPYQNPANAGFFYIPAGSFGRAYTVQVGGISATYTTPSGAGAGDAALSTPEYIAQQLATQLDTDPLLDVYRDGPYVFVRYPGAINVNSSVGQAYMVVSKQAMVTNTGLLPARLPSQADGYICRVGTGSAAQYYRYNHATTEWLESASWGSPSGITGGPVNLYWNGSAIVLDTSPLLGRLAGDDENNPLHYFMTNGFTGMGTHQGRLVLLSGPMVSLSASNNPRQFFRSTVTGLVNSDPIEIGSSMLSAASYEYATPFQKDLLLFSTAYQAVLPSGNSIVTPANATVVPTSAHETDTLSGPVIIGRTLMYPAPRSVGFFGVMEMVPSGTTDSQYVSQDSSPHLPRYMKGRCRFSASSGSSNIAVFGTTDNYHELIVHEYQWSGADKAQQAWHRWVFEYPIASVYFAADSLMVVFAQNNTVVMCKLDPRSGSYGNRGEVPMLDMHYATAYGSNSIAVPLWLRTFDPAVHTKLAATVSSGSLIGDRIGVDSTSTTALTTVESFTSGDAFVGVPYRSAFTPSPPVVRDFKERPILTGAATLLRVLANTENSDEYSVTVSDRTGVQESQDVAPITWSSLELALGQGRYDSTALSVIPCRTDMRTSNVQFWTEGTGELNIASMEYVGRYNAKIKRR